MAVGIDIVVDPSGAVSGGRVATTSLDQIEKAADGATRGTNLLRDELTTMSAAAFASSQKQAMYAKSLQGTTVATKQLTTATNTAGNSMGKFQGFVGQAGFQLSDIAIQLGMGANAAMVFGIQGGQLLGFLSPLAGALATVSGILIGQFTGGMYASADATRELDTALERTNEEINELTQNQARFASARLAESLQKDRAALNETTVRLSVLNTELERSKERVDAISKSQIIGKGVLLAAENLTGSIEDQEKAIADLVLEQERLTQGIDTTAEAQQKYQTILDGNKVAAEDSVKTTERMSDTVLNMSQNLIVLQTRLEGNNREAAIQEAVFRTGAEAGSAYAGQVRLLAGQQYDLTQAIQETSSAVKTFDKDGSYIESLQRQVSLVNLAGREQAMLRAEYALTEDATDAQVQQTRELAGALFDAQQAKKIDTSDQDFETSVTGASLAIAEENMTLLEELENQRAMILLYQEEGIGDATAHAKALASLDKKSLQERSNITASGLGSILALQQAYGDDSSGIYKTLLIAQKTATLYSVLLSSQEAIGKAWASAPFPYNLGAVATATVETGALAAGVEAITPSFATGGLAFGPGTGTSDSFTANLSNGEFVMPQRETSRNLGLLQSMRAGNDVSGGGAPVKVNVINQTTGRVDSASAEWVSRDELSVILSEEVPGIVASEFNDEYSQTNKAAQSQYTLQRNL